MLEGIAVILRVVIELVGISEEIATCTEGIRTADIRARQTDALRLLDGKHILGIAVERLAYLIPDIGVGILVGDNLHGILHAGRAMVSGQYERKA